jgi:aminopeptidase N
VWTAPHQVSNVGLALYAGIAAYEYYTNAFGLALPITKADFVAVPGKQGAMENWGLLMFDEDRWALPALRPESC